MRKYLRLLFVVITAACAVVAVILMVDSRAMYQQFEWNLPRSESELVFTGGRGSAGIWFIRYRNTAEPGFSAACLDGWSWRSVRRPLGTCDPYDGYPHLSIEVHDGTPVAQRWSGALGFKFFSYSEFDHPDVGRYLGVQVPYIVLCVVCLVPLFLRIRRPAIDAARAGQQICANCGYDLRASPERCPECGLTMRTLKSLAVLLVLVGILGAAPPTGPTLKLTDKQIVAGYEVALKASQTRDGVPRRTGVIKTEDGSHVPIAIIGEEGHPILITLPGVTVVPGAFEGNAGTIKAMQTIFCNVVDVEGEKAAFTKMLRDLIDALNRGDENVIRIIGEVQVIMEAMRPQNNDNWIDVTMTMKPKPG